MATTNRPKFFELTREDSLALLERNEVGRLAFTFHGRVDIEPISYVFAGAWVYGRTSPGTKLTTLEHSPWVAFEVDEVAGRFDWRSVVVRGTIYFLDPDGGERDREEFTKALAFVRTFDPAALTAEDATPERTTLFCVHIDDVHGRGARPE